MKILFASSSSGSRGGGEAFLIYLAQALARRGHEVMLWASSHSRMDEIAARFAPFGSVHRAEYTNTYDRPRRSLAALMDRLTAIRAARDWEALKPDIVHVNKQNLEDGLELLRATRMVSIPSVCTVHITQSAAFLGAKGAWLRDWVARRGLRLYRGPLVAVAEPREAELRHFLGAAATVASIPNGVPIPPALTESEINARRTALGVSPGELAILAVGRLTEQKRPMLFLEIAAQILQRVPTATFLWIGDGPLAAEWIARAAALGIASRARILGWRQDVAALLAGGDLLLHTAQYEGMPLAVLEAMAASLPCAVSEHVHREMPFLDETNSIRIAGAAWLDVLRDPAELARRGKAAGALAATRFSTEVMATAYEHLYRQHT